MIETAFLLWEFCLTLLAREHLLFESESVLKRLRLLLLFFFSVFLEEFLRVIHLLDFTHLIFVFSYLLLIVFITLFPLVLHFFPRVNLHYRQLLLLWRKVHSALILHRWLDFILGASKEGIRNELYLLEVLFFGGDLLWVLVILSLILSIGFLDHFDGSHLLFVDQRNQFLFGAFLLVLCLWFGF